jgi:hypothetical protein
VLEKKRFSEYKLRDWSQRKTKKEKKGDIIDAQ